MKFSSENPRSPIGFIKCHVKLINSLLLLGKNAFIIIIHKMYTGALFVCLETRMMVNQLRDQFSTPQIATIHAVDTTV